MTRPARSRLLVLALGVLAALGPVACSGSDGPSDEGATTTTAGVTTGTGDPALGRLAELDGRLDGLSDGDLDCDRTTLAVLALGLQPVAVLTGADPGGVEQLQQDVATLRAQVPADVAPEVDTYAQGVQAFAAALQGVDPSDLQDPAIRQQVAVAADALEAPPVVEARAAIEAWLARTCPAPATTTTTG